MGTGCFQALAQTRPCRASREPRTSNQSARQLRFLWIPWSTCCQRSTTPESQTPSHARPWQHQHSVPRPTLRHQRLVHGSSLKLGQCRPVRERLPSQASAPGRPRQFRSIYGIRAVRVMKLLTCRNRLHLKLHNKRQDVSRTNLI